MDNQNKELNIIFLDNRKDLTLNQMQYFHKNLLEMFEGSEKEKEIIKGINISALEEVKFSMQTENNIKINFIGETLEVDFGSEGQLNDESIKKVDQVVKNNISYPMLCVVDLCLDSLDQEPNAGELVGNRIKKMYKENADVLFMSGNINFWYSKNASEDCWFVYRACREDIMNEGFEASAASPYTNALLNNFGRDEPMFELIRYLLCSKYYNRQYLGVVLLKACFLLKKQ